MTVEPGPGLPSITSGEPAACPCQRFKTRPEMLGRFATLAPGHVIRTMVEEHDRLLALLDELARAVARIDRVRTWAEVHAELPLLRVIVDHFVAAEPHHLREERVLFTRMGQRGVVGAPEVMAREHDTLRASQDTLLDLARAPSGELEPFREKLRAASEHFAEFLREHIFKENVVLYPYALRVITDAAAWETMREECDAIGYSCLTPSRHEI